MSIKHPKQRQIRLPFAVPRPGLSEAPKRICGICRQKDSQYTCPRCNVAYCSLACFKDQSHTQCSEPFYRNTVLESIAADPKADTEEKRRMMDMLRRFENAQVEGEDVLSELEKEDEDEGDEDELARALDGVDLDEIDTNELLRLLPQSHRDAFLASLRNPESEETKALVELAAQDEAGVGGVERGALPEVLPWWEAGQQVLEDVGEGGEGEGGGAQQLRYAESPVLVSQDVLAGIKPPEGTGIKLAYNAIAISLAYVHILLSYRLPSLDHAYLSSQHITPEEIKSDLASLLPFLTDPKSTIRYNSIREAWTAVWEPIGQSLDTPPTTDLLIRLLALIPSLLQPSIISDQSPRIALLLSDTYHLFSTPKAGTAGARKLAFYLAALRGISRNDWLRLKSEVEKEVEKLRDELEDDPEPQVARPALQLEG